MILRVIERESRKPVPGAQVRVRNEYDITELATNVDGACDIPCEGASPESIGIYVSKPSFVPVRLVWRHSPLPGEFTLTLNPGTTVRGRVLDESGVPVPGATVSLVIWKKFDEPGVEVNADIWDREAITDSLGQWHYDEAPSGIENFSYRLIHPDFVEEVHGSRTDQPIEKFRDGSAVLTLKKGVLVTGIILDSGGNPLPGAEILPGKDRVCSPKKPVFRSNESGGFSIHLDPQSQVSLTIKAPGHAAALVSFLPGSEALPFRIPMQPGRTLRVRVVDEDGAPIAGVITFADKWRDHRTLEWCERTNAEGEITWDAAPDDEVLFDFLKRGYRDSRMVPLTASGDMYIIVMRSPLTIKGTVTDSLTGEPVQSFRLISGCKRGGQINWSRDRIRECTGGKFERTSHGGFSIPGDLFFLRIEADGYISAHLPIPEAANPAIVDFSLQPGPPLSGHVLNPDNSPAHDAEVWIVFEQCIQLHGDKLRTTRDGAIRLTPSADGSISFPSQEPTYLIAAISPLGMAFATGDQFTANPILQIQAWGRLEIATDASDTSESIPFSIHYPQLPRDPRGAPLIYIKPMATRISPDRILFEKLLPGRAMVNRGMNGNCVTVLIEPAKTVTLDFDRRADFTGKPLPGHVAVKVINESGNPVQGATIFQNSFRMLSRHGSSSRMVSRTPGPKPILTDSRGIAMIDCSMSHASGFGPAESVSLKVTHPKYCAVTTNHPLTGEALPIVLLRGAAVKLFGHSDDAACAGLPIYVQVISADRDAQVDPDCWSHENTGCVSSTQIPPGRHFLRLVCFPENGSTRFSPIVEFDAHAGDARQFRLELSAGAPLVGHLDPAVPRPVIDGRVEIKVSTEIAGIEECMQWRARMPLGEDGSFSFDSLPAGKIEVVAHCVGYASQDLKLRQSHGARHAQQFAFDTHAAPIVIAMEPTATVHLEIRDDEGKPITDARVHFNPNVVWADRSSSLFAPTGLTTAESLRLDPESRANPFLIKRGAGLAFGAASDQEGRATVENLPSGKQSFYVISKDHDIGGDQGDFGRPRFQDINLEPGEVRTVKIVMQKKPDPKSA